MTGGGSILKVMEMLENDVFDAKAGRVKGEDLIKSILVPSKGSGNKSKTAGCRRDMDEDSIHSLRRKTTFTEERGILR